jgi:hypothetical protein
MLVNDLDREHETPSTILSNQAAFHTPHSAALDANPLAHYQAEVRLCLLLT